MVSWSLLYLEPSWNEGQEQLPHGPAFIVSPTTRECSCGKWQEYLYPCRHAIAWFRKWRDLNLDWILDHEVDDLWRFKNLKALYLPNLYPVIWSTLRCDEVTLPPLIRKQSGRPKKKRIRKRVQTEGMVATFSTTQEEDQTSDQMGQPDDSDSESASEN